jgi:thiamine-phosphate pyrophosphorylase
MLKMLNNEKGHVMRYISKLHYITQDIDGVSHLDLAKRACEEGIDWIQLRIKNRSDDEFFTIASAARRICDQYRVTLIVNDNVTVAKEVRADGVHLGKEDMDPEEARAILGNDFIIGGTANTFEDIQRLYHSRVNYIGLGPYRFTATKAKLSPVLGLEGYRGLLLKCKDQGINIPIIAIGGIIKSDVASLLESGVHGVAVASALALSNNFKNAVSDFKEVLIH